MSQLEKQIIDSGFTMIPNELRDHPNLSFKAKGIWVYIWGKPDGWDFAVKRIAKDSDDGVKSVTSGIQELEKAGYLVRTRLKGGRVVYKIYAILASKGLKNSSTEGGRLPETRNDTLPKRQSVKTGTVSNKDYKKNIEKESDFSKEKSSLTGNDLKIKSGSKENNNDDISVVNCGEDGEEKTHDSWGNPLVKKEKVKREGKNQIALRIQRKFGERCFKEFGTTPISDTKGYIRILEGMKSGLEEKDFVELFEDWFGAGYSDEDTVQITRVLSNIQINKFKVRNEIK